jgi:hypothetical protein
MLRVGSSGSIRAASSVAISAGLQFRPESCAPIMGVYITGIYLMGVRRIGVYPIDVYLIGIDLISIRLKKYIFWGCVFSLRFRELRILM